MSQWSTASAIRDRREQLGLSQADLAEILSVSKSFLSHLEAGNRQPTEDQLTALAGALRMPADLLMLGSGRLPEDIRDAFSTNAAEVVAAVRQRTEAQAVAYPHAPEVLPLPKEAANLLRQTELPERIEAQKTSTSYRAHSYHTKVPPEAITPFIRAYTNPGDLVFDPFCGSGMTGVAALMENRNALLSDLSPAAVHIARNYTTPCDPDGFAAAYERIAKAVAPTIDWLYRPLNTDRIVEYMTWSDIYRCPQCLGRIVYWDVVHQTGGISADRVTCPHCSTKTRKSDFEWIGEMPVQSHTSQGSNRIDSHDPTRDELVLIEHAAKAPIPYWTPEIAFGAEREMWRASHRSMGVLTVADFFTRRNLHALAALRHAIVNQSEGRIREALMFAFTAAVNRASRRYQWNAKRPTNVMTGTLYISSLRYEWNVWSLFRRKAADVLRYYRAFPATTARADVFQRSAADLDCLPDRSVDFVFMDPPFGANIFYADSSLLWDAWLGEMTDQSAEIVINKSRAPASGGKTVEHYGDLMGRAFSHASRVLKPGGRAVLAFSNSDDNVWKAIQTALTDAGFDTESVHLLYKGQPSIKGVKGVTGKEHVTTLDLMLCLRHRAPLVAVGATFAPPTSMVDQVIRNALASGGGRNDEIYSAVVQAALASNYSVAGITMPIIAQRCRELGAHDLEGRWVLPGTDATVPDEAATDFVSGYLSPIDLLPTGDGGAPIDDPLPAIRVAGGRSSPFYLAHSYHTKVPPEAITPFIEHYTNPGDVVLDPFCGSGMTGVAAAITGRRAILNDLSPAAIHLAWNHTRACDPAALAAGFAQIENRLGERFKGLYRTSAPDGRTGLIHWTLWSTRHRCPACSEAFLLWDVMDRSSGRLGAKIACPHCSSEVKRTTLENLGSVPAWIAYETADGKRAEKAASAADIELALSHERAAIDAWFPETPLGGDREMYIRCALHLQGVESIADLYTPRNLHALALLWQEIMEINDDRVQRALAFAFTNTAWHGTRMRRFNARGGQRPLTGTLYIPQLSSEANVLEVMRNKIAQLERYYRNYQPHADEAPALTLGSATDLSGIADGSIDYIFTDPPFGSNIFYSDCNLIWESWLGRLTDGTREAVVNRSLTIEKGGKSLSDYADLIKAAMREMARVLKPQGWATVVFHNTDAEVWEAIRNAARDAGFTFHEAASLDRRQQSHKGYKGRSGEEDVAHFDVVFNLRKSAPATQAQIEASDNSTLDLAAMVKAIMKDCDVAQRGLQGVHAEVMRRLASSGSQVFVDYAQVRAIFEQYANKRSKAVPQTD
ncbi:DNA methyltransferase [Burkholderia cenocepacia]|uniref:DNA methyltransferase n=1 Tax=Burkholderia cenocepacia TaxID=95486 RepID=UPI001FB80D42|nr:DNA methyltransferase [Burkholderia cenocepacia]MDR5644444.1 DNA methyltransferase [Burkholderia cenocepacia]